MLRGDAPAKVDFEDDVDGDVVVLSLLLETEFLVYLVVVTAFWVFSCDDM